MSCNPEDFPPEAPGQLLEMCPGRGVCYRGTAGGAITWLWAHAKGPWSNFAFVAQPHEERALSEYGELKALGLSDRSILMLRNIGATHAAIVDWARRHFEELEPESEAEAHAGDWQEGSGTPEHRFGGGL